MKLIESAEQLTELPDHSVLVLASEVTEDRWWMDTSIYQKFGGTWTEMDPADRYDGERSWSDADIMVIATQRDKRIPFVVFDPREAPAAVPAEEN